jgi:hypothetical protein
MVAPAEQRRVFVRPPAGVRKIVMATNIGGRATESAARHFPIAAACPLAGWTVPALPTRTRPLRMPPNTCTAALVGRSFTRRLSRPPASPPNTCTAAETAITIDDVVVVINSGRLKEKSYDPYTNVSTLMVCVC